MTKRPLPQAAFFCNNSRAIDNVYGEQRIEAVRSRTRLYAGTVGLSNFTEHVPHLQELEYIFTTWGFPSLDESQIASLPRLKAVFYAAGSVQGFARPFLASGVKVFSAWAANAIPVAEFTLAQILLSCKGYFRNTRECHLPDSRQSHRKCHSGTGIYGNSVALIGFGMIGRKLADLLRPYHLDVMVVDPYVPDEMLAAHQARRVTMETAFAEAYIVSNHLPNLPATKGILNEPLFRSMRQDATFINTGRGAQVVEADLIRVLQDRPDLTALLDVTFPEPPVADSPLYTLPNVQLSSHIAGSIGHEVHRMADTIIEEFDRLVNGDPTRYEVTEKLLETMA